jgi:hypothetical protein
VASIRTVNAGPNCTQIRIASASGGTSEAGRFVFQTAAGKVLPLEIFEESLFEFLSMVEFRSCFLDLRIA